MILFHYYYGDTELVIPKSSIQSLVQHSKFKLTEEAVYKEIEVKCFFRKYIKRVLVTGPTYSDVPVDATVICTTNGVHHTVKGKPSDIMKLLEKKK